MGSGDNKNIGAGFRGGGRRRIERVLMRRGGVSGSEWFDWNRME